MLILWTIQTSEAWREAEAHGVLRASRTHIYEDYLPAYDWLVAEMRQRVGAPPSGVQYPVWAWEQYRGTSAARPDLPAPGHLPAGTRGVCIEFTVAPDAVLLSDFDLWHYVLNRFFLATTLEEVDLLLTWNVDERDVYTEAEIRASWSRIFDLDFASPEIAWPRAEKSLQATVWEVPLSSIRVVQEFTAL